MSNNGKLEHSMYNWLSTEKNVIDQKIEKSLKSFLGLMPRKSPEYVKVLLSIFNYMIVFREEVEMVFAKQKIERERTLGSWDQINFWFSIIPDMQLGKKLQVLEIKDKFTYFSKDLKRTVSLPSSKLQVISRPKSDQMLYPMSFGNEKKSPNRKKNSPLSLSPKSNDVKPKSNDVKPKKTSFDENLMYNVLNDSKVSLAEKLLHIYQQPAWANEFMLWMRQHKSSEDSSNENYHLFVVYCEILNLKENYLQSTKLIYETIFNNKIDVNQKVVLPLKLMDTSPELFVLKGLEKEIENKLLPFVELFISGLKKNK